MSCTSSPRASHRLPRTTLSAAPLIQRCGEFGGEKEQRYLESLVSRLTQERVTYRFILVRCPEAVALSVGEGIVVLSRGLIEKTPNEATLAFVLAHEIIHDVKGHHHSLESVSSLEARRELQQSLELEADREAVVALMHTGYDPRVAVDALVMTHKPRDHQEASGYPDLKTRIEQIRTLILKAGWLPPGTIDRREFRHFQSRVRQGE